MSGGPRIAVVVPVYDVEDYLEACLDSIAGQTVEELDVVMVDDGSTDGSTAIAEEYARRDARFRLVRQPNGGLSRARNTGIEHTRSEFLAFVDSDDVLPRNAYELLLGALDETGSDFATGNVHRLIRGGTMQAPFLARTFPRTELRTHVTRFKPLLADRTAWNKLWRRSFWDRNGWRFPEGVLHEDIPIVLPAHFRARSVDVISDPVYYYRIRGEGEQLSITQRRAEPRVLRDRLAALEQVRDFIAEHGPRRARGWYYESVVGDDLRLHLNVLDTAGDEYRELFLDRVNAFLHPAGERIYRDLPAVERLKWHLVRRRAMPELLEVLRFQREELDETPAVRIGGRFYGDYPYRTDARLAIPKEVFRLGQELTITAQIEALGVADGKLRVTGHAYMRALGAPEPDTAKVRLHLVRRGRFRRLKERTTALALDTRAVHRPEITADAQRAANDLSWSGFEATLDPRRLRTLGRWRDATWELHATIRAGRERRRRRRFLVRPGNPVGSVDLPAGDASARATTFAFGVVSVEVHERWARADAARLAEDGVLELSGAARVGAATAKLRATRRVDGVRRTFPAELSGDRFTARVALAELLAAPPAPAPARAAVEDPDEDDEQPRAVWELALAQGGRATRVGLPEDVVGPAWRRDGHELSLFRTRLGVAGLADQPQRAVIGGARWTEGGALELRGELPAALERPELVLANAERGEEWAFACTADGRAFAGTLTPAAVRSPAGVLPLINGRWELYARAAGAGSDGMAPMGYTPELRRRLPLGTVAGHKPFLLAITRDDRAILTVKRDLDEDERGPHNQRRLRLGAYRGGRDAPLADAVVYSSFGGRQYSDSPRAIHEELVRRGAPLEHLWVVRDGMVALPETATLVREGSREHYDAMARARYVVDNDHFPDWFERREDQVCLQTWHGTPLKRLGLDVSERRRMVRQFQFGLDRQVANWQYVVSPNRFSTPILRRAYDIRGEMLETGYPRDDVLAGAGRDERGRAVRRALGLPDGARVVLYAPTYRDHVVDRRGRYRLDLHLDLERLRGAAGPDTVVLVRRHHYHYMAERLPGTEDGFVRDVSAYPDGTELLLAADVLVTDYSSMMVDFANTGRPMLFFTYDLDGYRDEIRGFYLDFVATVPGPLLRTTDEVVEALRDLDAVRTEHAERYAAFRETFCELDDGRAAARVVDRVFAS
jgi:CDP-glycerol glycerophosphotransferase